MSDPAPPAASGRLIWGGFCLSAWLRLLARNRFDVAPPFRRAARTATLLSAVSSLLGVAQEMCFGRAIRRTKLRDAPIFILGHWRCGTTFLFDLLSRDERFAYPDTYECFFPGHFLVSRDFVTRRVPLGGDRGVDRVPLGWGQPREDEFALCALGAPSPYLTAAFPNRPPQCPESLDLHGLSPRDRHAWARTYHRFLQALTLKKGKRLLLKCPPHTARLRVLGRRFPDARFIHIVRDPFAVIPSTLRLWRTVFDSLGLQTPTYAGLEDYVFENFRCVYQRLDQDRPGIPASRFHELRYEDLVAGPLGQLRTIYERLALEGFEQQQPELTRYLATLRDYEPNRHQLSPELRAGIQRHCGDVLRRYGYRSDAK
ncbi:MAG: sulfotransferase [Gemmataceae bacterium]|nr:sulfotransferase [Gemmataceae bacterium]